MSGDYLVIYEEDSNAAGDSTDELVLDVRTLRKAFRQHLDVETGVQVDIINSSSGMGLLGLIVTLCGALVALASVVILATTYPADWFVGADVGGYAVRRMTALLAVLGGFMLIGGTILTAFGRRVTAHATIDDAHIIEKGAHGHADLS